MVGVFYSVITIILAVLFWNKFGIKKGEAVPPKISGNGNTVGDTPGVWY